MKAKRIYDVEDMDSALIEAINHINNALDELNGMLEYQSQIDELVGIRNDLEQLQEETNDIVCKIREEEQRELEREFDRMRI